MDFNLPDHVEALRDEVRRFAHEEILPHVMTWDEEGTFPEDVMRRLGEMGMLGVIFPEAYDGAGMGYLEYAVVVEELSRVDGSVGLGVAAHNSLCSNHIYAMGTEAQRERWLRPLASGRMLGAWALTEPEAGSDAGALRTTARKDGDHWVLNGSKCFATHGTVGGVCVVMARTRHGSGPEGISAFVVEKGTPGFRAGKQENKLGMRASDTSELILEDVRVPEANLLGEEGVGFKQAMKTLDGGRIGIAALALGMAQGAFEASVKYARIRKAFGKTLAEHQAIQFKLADMQVGIEASRLLVYKAATLKDQGRPYAQAAAIAKLHASETACRVAEEAVQIHGGYGFIKDYPAEKYYRDVKLCTIGEGTSEIQRMVIARHLLKEY
ncbi:acyl-CoA dehydrogenase [Mesoterricola sediminis]|uniref:Cyclohexane-1-carbonyl-CoA dehydrogenase n=1 Tax=Mesoterricola sediminis TaxID=2927980 RepID=A0AA48GUY8_9BACT|nr:acyl-CoA dehydrogenase [Mesoterricola sediminis]BDU76105.1 acyl-CoA dehydrogenase [Mesoterricola sediminis]